MREGVVLLHGIIRTHRSMGRLARFLERHGFAVLNMGYPSTKYSIEALADLVHPQIAAFAESMDGDVHFVGHSMGGLVIRAYLHRHRPARLGRVVMVGTPNQGSEVADFLRNTKLYRWVYGPAGQQLVTDQSDFVQHFGAVDYPLGIIAGSKPVDPIASRLIGKQSDGTVSIDSTKVDGMTDHVVVRSSHTLFPENKKMWEKTLAFLRHGKF